MRCTIIALVLGIVIVASAGPTATAQEADAGVLEAVKALTPEDVRALIESAQVGDAQAQLMLALAYHHGYTVTQIQSEAFKWSRMAAEQGVAHAQHLLGQMYRDGQGVDQNVNEAAKWIGMAAEQGFAEAEYEYGLMSLDGVGVPQDEAEAFKWFDRAAEQESLGGQTYVGFMYVNGLGVTKNLSEGRRYLLAAANRGSPMAQANLGTLYANGVGVAKDPAEALMWFLLADAGEFEGVQPLIDGLQSQMTEEEVTKAKRRAEAQFKELSGDRATASVASDAVVPTEPSLSPEARRQALEEIGEWLSSNLPKFGKFSLELIKDLDRAISQLEEMTKVRVLHEYNDVSLQDCTLRYVETVTARVTSGFRELDLGVARPLFPGQGPQRWTLMLRLGAIDISSVRTRAYELPSGWRVELSQRLEVYLKARPGAGVDEAFIEISPEGADRYLFEQSIPVDKPGSARILVETLRHAAQLCGAK